jgi:uncharacterized RDD family membrane protein YckC
MSSIDDYVAQVLDRLPPGSEIRSQVEMEVRSHIAERVEHGEAVEAALKQLGDPVTLAESYLAAVPLVPVPFWTRLWAKLIDFAIVAATIAPLVWMALTAHLSGFAAVLPFAICGFGLAVVLPGYPILAEYRFGQTVGKHLFGLRVVRESGGRISLGQSIVRQLPAFFQVFWIDAMFALFTDKHQRAFELLSKTRVVLAGH